METWNETDEWADRYVRGDLSGEDRVALIKWLEASPEHLRQFRKILQTEMRVSAAGKWRRLEDNDNMDKEFRTRVEGELNISRWGTNLRAGVENIKNYTYFNQSALPEQNGGNIQVLSATLKQDFRLGVFHLDNEVTWQKTSNETVLPLPQLSLYHNFYILAKLAKKVLTVQLGADVRYFTKYNAPAYAPGVQQFHLQPTDDLVEIGGYR